MMNTFKTAALALALVAGGAVAASAAVVTAIPKAPQSWGEVDLGNTLDTPNGVWSTSPAITTGTDLGPPALYKSPFNPVQGNTLPGWEDIPFYTAGSPSLVPSPAVLTYAADQNVLKFLWGSVDVYNEVRFFLDGVAVDSVTGADIHALGALTAAGAAFVKIVGVTFDEVQFFSNFGKPNGNDTAAFEFASVSAVPLPAGALLLLTAIGGVAALRRRKAA